MMKYIVINDFIESGSLKEIRAGESYACLDPKRAEKLISHGYIKPVEDEGPAKEPVEKPRKTTAKAANTKRSVKANKKA